MAGKKPVHAVVVSHKGCVRSNNEDNFFFNGDYMPLQDMNMGALIEHEFNDKLQVYAVFDGMGGGDGGERASSIAAQTIQSYYMRMNRGSIQKLLKEYAYKSNDRVVEDGRKNQADMQGTTMAVLVLKGDTAYIANVGDSRVYLLRNKHLTQLSMDHSVVGELVRDNRLTEEQARKSPNNNVITHYLGMPPEEMVSRFVFQTTDKVQQGDRFMLCSDGLSDLLPNSSIEKRMMSIGSACECAKQLVVDALERGGKDNITCIIADYDEFRPSSVQKERRSAVTQVQPLKKAEEEDTTSML